jgi:hypothetical protein
MGNALMDIGNSAGRGYPDLQYNAIEVQLVNGILT